MRKAGGDAADDIQLLGAAGLTARLAALRRLRLSRSAVDSRWARAVAGVFAGASGSGRLVGSGG
ncbi:hypothetical protein ASD25_24265 [Brevundimonas sp. Root1423]|nr:hypothetical protein ASD25_24265 [Brevundimonas sp. Root1423]